MKRTLLTTLLLPWMLTLTASSLADPGGGGPRQVIATLAGEPIYLDEIEPRAAFRLYTLRLEMHRLLERETEALADRRLLVREAARSGLDPDTFLERLGGPVQVTPEDVDDYLREHPDAGTDAASRERIRNYLAERTRIERVLDLRGELRERAGFALKLEAPAPPRVEIDVAGAPGRGPADAPVVIVHFSDLHGARAGAGAAYIERVWEAFPGKIRQLHRPLLAAGDTLGIEVLEWADAAERAGRFWELYDRLAALDGRTDREGLRQVAARLGLHLEPDSRSRLRQMRDRLAVAREVGLVHGSALFVNGRYFSPTFPYADLETVVREELAAQGGR